jgi:putative ABC transport system ATP-binding protein
MVGVNPSHIGTSNSGPSKIGDATPHLRVEGLVHRFHKDAAPAVDIDWLEIASGRMVAITGASGSGKTTLAYLLTGIEPVQKGSVKWGDVELAGMREATRDRWRRQRVGFVFQDFHLVPGLSIERNVLISAYFEALRASAALAERGRALLDAFAVPRQHRRIVDLSRGEQQRVAVARALVRSPGLIIADEPTASLDATSGRQVIDLLLDHVRRQGATLLAVTHDSALIEAVDQVYKLERGRLVT